MTAPLIISVIGSALTIYYTYIDYREGKVTKKHMTTLSILSSIVIASGVFQLFRFWG